MANLKKRSIREFDVALRSALWLFAAFGFVVSTAVATSVVGWLVREAAALACVALFARTLGEES